MPTVQATTMAEVSQSRLPGAIRPEWPLRARKRSPVKAKQLYETSVIIAARAMANASGGDSGSP